MATYAQIARAHLGNLGKVSLGFYPTPFHKLESISSAYDVNLWIKREDFSGSTLFGGNKIRKLEYLLHDAKQQGCDTVFTYGATQSNHVMETATAARRCGMSSIWGLSCNLSPMTFEPTCSSIRFWEQRFTFCHPAAEAPRKPWRPMTICSKRILRN